MILLSLPFVATEGTLEMFEKRSSVRPRTRGLSMRPFRCSSIRDGDAAGFALANRRSLYHAVSGAFIGASVIAITLLLAGCGGGSGNGSAAGPATISAPAAVAVGERLFLETRFAQAFKSYLDQGGAVNDRLSLGLGDPVMSTTQTTDPNQPLPGPFAGLSMNCRACHLVDEQVSNPRGGMRTYSDFARRSPLPGRSDGKTTAPRNSPSLVNASLDRPGGALFHFDGEFSTIEDLVSATLTGRNFGWLPGQKTEALAHIARVVREDDGSGNLAQQFGGLSYRILFSGTNSAIPEALRLPPDFRASIESGSDQDVVDAIVKLVAAYVTQLQFSQRDPNGTPIRSPFDVFLELNGLPTRPENNETPFAYSRRLLGLVNTKEQASTLQFVTANPNRTGGQFQFHSQAFAFGANELAGLKIFFAEPVGGLPNATELAQGRIGSCHLCHAAPNFTDFIFRNTGVAQKEYDDIHGTGSFASLFIPTLAQRNATPENYLPATHDHPNYREPFRSIPSAGSPELTDLGVWNILLNPDMPAPQQKLTAILCGNRQPCPQSDDVLLASAVARFKTPGLRDLGHSGPYMHNGQFDTLDAAVAFYIFAASVARQGALRNGSVTLNSIALTPADVASLAAFLKSLNEDYQKDQRAVAR